jgi:histidyl-tRNA synthetase
LYTDADKVGKQFKYAASRNIPFVAVVGTDEKASNEVSIKDLRTGEQQRVSRSSAAAVIRGKLR